MKKVNVHRRKCKEKQTCSTTETARWFVTVENSLTSNSPFGRTIEELWTTKFCTVPLVWTTICRRLSGPQRLGTSYINLLLLQV
jgi:hypothetical protein